MKRNEIMKNIEEVAFLNTFYHNLNSNLKYLEENNQDMFNELMEDWEQQDIKDIVDLMLFLEC